VGYGAPAPSISRAERRAPRHPTPLRSREYPTPALPGGEGDAPSPNTDRREPAPRTPMRGRLANRSGERNANVSARHGQARPGHPRLPRGRESKGVDGRTSAAMTDTVSWRGHLDNLPTLCFSTRTPLHRGSRCAPDRGGGGEAAPAARITGDPRPGRPDRRRAARLRRGFREEPDPGRRRPSEARARPTTGVPWLLPP
jgi:hypothetical protein